MKRFECSKHFVKYTDPESGIVSYVFNNAAIPLSQSFYFTNPSATDDGRYVWMYCAFPPAASAAFGRVLGVVDTAEDSFHCYHETAFLDASPLVDRKNGEIWWCNHQGIWKRSPAPSASPELVAPTPSFLKGKGILQNLATHLTFSPDGKRLSFDAIVGNRFYVGDVDIASGEYELWREFDYCRNHAQLNPVKPDMLLLSEDDWREVDTGVSHTIRYDEQGRLARMYVLEKGKEPVYIPPLYTEARHEWWSADGESVYYVDWDNGTVRYELATGNYTVVDPRGTWHAHTTADGRYFVADENEIDGTKWFRGCKSRVHFYNTQTEKYVNIITENSALYTRDHSCPYHIDPHPQFTMAERAVMYTATVTGKVALAVTSAYELIKATE